jgi:ketosteroid isomerase-like protein
MNKQAFQRAALSAAVLLAAACTTPPASQTKPAATPAAVDVKAEAEAIQAVKAVNSTRMAASAYAEDAVVLPPHSPEITGREAIRARISAGLKEIAVEQTIQDEEHVLMSPGWMVERGRYVFEVSPRSGGPEREEAGNFLIIWKREADGQWKIAWEMWVTPRPLLETSAK